MHNRENCFRMMKKTYTYDEWVNLDESVANAIMFDFEGINEEQAINSDVGGDSDADDVHAEPTRQIHTRKKTAGLMQTSQASTSEMIMEPENSDQAFDSDDSIQDPDFEPVPPKQVFTFSDDSDSEVQTPSKTANETNDTYPFKKISNSAKTFEDFIFDRPFGPKIEVNIASPLEIFLSIIGPMIEAIVNQSNLYASQNGIQLGLSAQELKAFFGILIIMGFHVLPSLRLYWSTNDNFFVPKIANIMSLRRFQQILRNLHLNDNSQMPQRDQPNFDRLYKVRPLLDFLNKRYKEVFYPNRNLSIDESMIGFKGRSTLKQYMPLKPIKRGFKVWAIACATTGFLVGFEVYQGKSTIYDNSLTLGENVVLSLSTVFQTLGYCLFFDRFFTSIPLLAKLLDRGLFACGTMQINRKHYPKHLLCPDQRMKYGESDFAMANEISVCKWKDRGKKSVVVSSNMHTPSETTFVKRTNKEGRKEDVQCPKSISEYNKYMGGVDLFDQLSSCYSISWKSKRWWVKIFYYLMDSVVVNSFILYKTTLKLASNEAKPMSHLMFRSLLADQLIDNFSNKQKQVRKSKGIIVTKATKKTGRIYKQHMTITNVGEHLPEKGTIKRCAYCSTKKSVKRSTLQCSKCKVGLCVECFIPFHSK